TSGVRRHKICKLKVCAACPRKLCAEPLLLVVGGSSQRRACGNVTERLSVAPSAPSVRGGSTKAGAEPTRVRLGPCSTMIGGGRGRFATGGARRPGARCDCYIAIAS